MKYRLLDILACPYCKDEGFPLELHVIKEKTYEGRRAGGERPLCELYCGLKSEFIKNLKSEPPCDECVKREVVTGILYCRKCGRWYPVIDEIPRMLPDEYRKASEDVKFLKEYAELIPEHIRLEGKPFNLKTTSL